MMADNQEDSKLPIENEKPHFMLTATLTGIDKTVLVMRFSHDEKLLAVGCIDSSIKIWNIETEQSVSEFIGHKQIIKDFAWSKDKTLLVSASMDKTLRVWDLLAGKCLRILSRHNSGVCCCILSPNCAFVASGSRNGTILFWDIKTGIAIKIMQLKHQEIICSLQFNCDGSLILASTTHSWNLWDTAHEHCIISLESRIENSSILSASFTLDGKNILIATINGILELWSMSKAERQYKLHLHKLYFILGEEFLSLLPSPADEGPWVVSTNHNQRTLNVWDAGKNLLIQELKCHKDMITCTTSSSSQSLLASAAFGTDKTIKIWKNMVCLK